VAHSDLRHVVILVPVLAVLAGGWADPAAAGAGGFRTGGVGFGYSTSSHSHSDRSAFQYALIMRHGEMNCAVDNDAWPAIGDLQREVDRTGHDVFWFARDGRDYVIRDAATVARVHDIVEPMMKLGAEQGRLGSMQGELGRQQGEYGAMQGRLGAIQARIASLDGIDDSRYESEMRELRVQLGVISQRMRELGERQRTLGEQQQELGRQQRELGAQQRRASQLASDQLQSLADQAIAKGTAQAVDHD